MLNIAKNRKEKSIAIFFIQYQYSHTKNSQYFCEKGDYPQS